MRHTQVMRFLRLSVAFGIIPLTALSPISKAGTTPVETETPLPLSDLAVPEDLGKVQERFTSGSRRTIIQIQDVHAHAIAQQNIASLLERLRTVFEIETVALEGAWSTTSLPKSHALPTSREKQLLATTLLEDDLISGPAYAAIMSPSSLTLIGIEEASLYEKNRDLFLKHLATKNAVAGKIENYRTALQILQKAAWSPDLLAFNQGFAPFRETSDISKFLPILLESAERFKLELTDLPQITLLRETLALEKSFDKARLEREIKQVIKKYQNTPWSLEELIRSGRISQEEIGIYPEIKKLTRLYKMRDELILADLVPQFEILSARILEKLIRSREEKELWEKTERFYLAKKILLLEAGPLDLKAYERESAALKIELGANELAEALSLALEFYDTVKKRDQVFFDKITSDPTLAGNIAVVTGGFHTDGLSERFREAGLAYITIAPELGGISADEKLYETRMAEGKGRQASDEPSGKHPAVHPSSAEAQTLSELNNRLAAIDESFKKSYAILLQTRDARKAKAAFLGAPVAVSKAEQGTHLARTQRIVAAPAAGTTLDTSVLRANEFMKKTRGEQLQLVNRWLAQAPERRERAMLVSSVSVLLKMLEKDPRVLPILERAIKERDLIVLAQDIAQRDTPLSLHGIDRLEAPDITGMIQNTPRFQQLARTHPFAIMKEGYRDPRWVILPEKATSLLLYRIVTLSPSLYRAAKDPAFVLLLEDLASEILSQELSGKAA